MRFMVRSGRRTRHQSAVVSSQVIAFAIALLLLTVSAPVAQCQKAAQGLTLADVAHRVDDHYNRLHSLRVQFTETYRGMGMERTESGTLLLAKPGLMKWSYTRPAGKVFVIDKKYGYSYTPGDAQAQRYPVKKLQDFRSPLRFLLGHARIQKELDDLTMTPHGTEYQLRGIPRGMEQRVSQVDLIVTADGTITTIQWRETDGATTEFQLSEEQSNPKLPPSTFSFEAPPGVEVVQGLAPI